MRFIFNFVWLSLAAGATIRSPSAVSYDGFRVYRIRVEKQLASVRQKLSQLSSYQTWGQDHDKIDVVISPNDVATFESLGLSIHLMHENLGDSIAKEKEIRAVAKVKRQNDDYSADDPWFDSYHPYDDHIQYFRNLQQSFPNNSNWTSSGTSYEGRDIFGIHMWGKDGPGKPAVLWHGTVHAREWITTMTVEYLTKELIEGYKAGDAVVQFFLDKYDFYVLPIVNPDGFVWSQTNDRLWRKNRQPPPERAVNQTCIGRDINRNWEQAWDANSRGASTNPCSLTYRGEKPRDSPENAGLDDFARKIRDTQGIKSFIDWHSYSQLILMPYGYKETLYAPELGKWTKAASLMSQTIAANSSNATTFTFGPSGAVLYPTTGSSVDHMYDTGRTEWPFTIELPDTGDYGFVLPPERIRPAAEEQWVGQKVLLSLLDEEFFDGEGPLLM